MEAEAVSSACRRKASSVRSPKRLPSSKYHKLEQRGYEEQRRVMGCNAAEKNAGAQGSPWCSPLQLSSWKSLAKSVAGEE